MTTALDTATDLVDSALRDAPPALQAELCWAILVIAGAGLVTLNGAADAAEKVYRLGDGIVAREAEKRG